MSRRSARERGQAAVETALGIPLLLALLFMIIQAAMIAVAKQEAMALATEIASTGADRPELLAPDPGRFMDERVYARLDAWTQFRRDTGYTGRGIREYMRGAASVREEYRPLLEPRERRALEGLESGGSGVESAALALAALDVGYERITVTLLVAPVGLVRWIHPGDFVVKATALRGLSEGFS